MTLTKRPFEDIVGKGEKWWSPAFSPFLTMFSTLSKTKTIILSTFIVYNAFNLNQSKILSFELTLIIQSLPFKNLNPFPNDKFQI